MKSTRYAQSCLLIETNNKRILIDPGNINYDTSLLADTWSDIDILLVTHKHSDHCHVEAIQEIVKNKKTDFYTTKEVADAYPELSPQLIKVNDILEFDDIKVEVVNAVHGYIPTFKTGKEVKENVGYIVDDGNARLYHPSDTIGFFNDYKCDILFIPVVGHGIVLGPWEAALFAKETEAKMIVPFHYDNPKHPVDFELIKKEFDEQSLNYKFLEIGESVEN